MQQLIKINDTQNRLATHIGMEDRKITGLGNKNDNLFMDTILRSEIVKLWTLDQIQLASCFCMACELRMVFAFINS